MDVVQICPYLVKTIVKSETNFLAIKEKLGKPLTGYRLVYLGYNHLIGRHTQLFRQSLTCKAAYPKSNTFVMKRRNENELRLAVPSCHGI